MKKHEPPSAFARLRKSFPLAEIRFGYTGIALVPLEDIPEAQRGYSIIPEGDTTDWQDAWLVIGYDTSLGDPLFIDTDIEELPVLTAPHGEGVWSPSVIAPSSAAFFEILAQFAVIAGDRGNPVALEKNPPSDEEREAFYEFVAQYFDGELPIFWELLVSTDL